MKPEDFITILDGSTDVQELEAVLEALLEERNSLRAKDSGGEQCKLIFNYLTGGFEVRKQLRKNIKSIPTGRFFSSSSEVTTGQCRLCREFD